MRPRGKFWCSAITLSCGLALWSCGDTEPSPSPGAGAGAGGGSGGNGKGGSGNGGSSGTTQGRGGDGGDAGETNNGQAGTPGVAGGESNAGNGGAASGGEAGQGGLPAQGGMPGQSGAAGSGGTQDGNGGASGSDAVGGAGGSASLGAAPIGLVTFVDASECPSGWEEALAARGRMIVSTVTDADVGKTMNAPLADREDRQHMHPWTGNASIGSVNVATTAGGNAAPGMSGAAPLSGPSELKSSGLPFTQLLACRLAQDLGDGDVFPASTVAHFDVAACPDGWSLHNAANDRILMPAPGSSGVSSGTGNMHAHAVTANFNVNGTSLSAAGGAGVLLASSGPVVGNGATDVDQVLGGLPTLELLVCHKDAAPPAAVAPPAETLLYVDADDCPSDWQRATEMEGRFLVGAPSGGLLGADFGGADLGSGEQRPHDHPISGSVSINPQAVAATTGGGTLVGASGFAQITGVAQFEEIAPLRLELRYCRKL